ncbi:hypothetical protein STXM2123_367 [Streptomyces sp. F-3]|nr:hypothetical protein STXM2123_367 [Streptomyces sp. F-3]
MVFIDASPLCRIRWSCRVCRVCRGLSAGSAGARAARGRPGHTAAVPAGRAAKRARHESGSANGSRPVAVSGARSPSNAPCIGPRWTGHTNWPYSSASSRKGQCRSRIRSGALPAPPPSASGRSPGRRAGRGAGRPSARPSAAARAAAGRPGSRPRRGPPPSRTPAPGGPGRPAAEQDPRQEPVAARPPAVHAGAGGVDGAGTAGSRGRLGPPYDRSLGRQGVQMEADGVGVDPDPFGRLRDAQRPGGGAQHVQHLTAARALPGDGHLRSPRFPCAFHRCRPIFTNPTCNNHEPERPGRGRKRVRHDIAFRARHRPRRRGGAGAPAPVRRAGPGRRPAAAGRCAVEAGRARTPARRQCRTPGTGHERRPAPRTGPGRPAVRRRGRRRPRRGPRRRAAAAGSGSDGLAAARLHTQPHRRPGGPDLPHRPPPASRDADPPPRRGHLTGTAPAPRRAQTAHRTPEVRRPYARSRRVPGGVLGFPRDCLRR